MSEQHYINTRASRDILEAIVMATRMRSIVQVSGPPGVGKTLALRRYAHQYRACYLRCTGFQRDVRELFKLMYAAHDLGDPAGAPIDIDLRRVEGRASLAGSPTASALR